MKNIGISGNQGKKIAGFENLRIWQKANELMTEIHNIAKRLPMTEKYRIRDQIERSSASVSANIAEGYSSYYYNDKIKGMYTARKEAGETQSHLRALESRKYLSEAQTKKLIEEYEGLVRGINAYINYVRDKREASKSAS
ncbi:MAG: hypothetical protein A2Z88_01045 [Omnitrophica WOR_2 bacterium GWA2_47_8]|nr:MAG: hypothetical protein A2Z88_01045 [Omnitrophica WOR_2 bacterium GWA2_47_8]